MLPNEVNQNQNQLKPIDTTNIWKKIKKMMTHDQNNYQLNQVNIQHSKIGLRIFNSLNTNTLFHIFIKKILF
jgi:hypothetical protein